MPTQSKHPKEAADLVKFLTSPQGQIGAFKAANNLPSSPQALNDPAVKAFSNPYFNNAPVGQIYGPARDQPQAGLPGADNQEVRQAVENTLLAVQQGKLKPGKAWDKAVKDAKQAASWGETARRRDPGPAGRPAAGHPAGCPAAAPGPGSRRRHNGSPAGRG